MTAHDQIAAAIADVKDEVLQQVAGAVDDLLLTTTRSPRELECALWEVVVALGRTLMEAALSLACWRCTLRETGGEPVKLRRDASYTVSQKTTFGAVQVPLCAYRNGRGATKAPARAEVFPLHPRCRSSELCLEWEARVGANLPFRQAEEALTFYSHGAITIEDNTIARHLGLIGQLVDRQWTYRPASEVAKLLERRATRDARSGRPLVYSSTDAHALRRYVDDTWNAAFRMINGIRFWFVDRHTGRIVHLGGEYTWGDCREVAARMKTACDHLFAAVEEPPQVVLISDGATWIKDHVVPSLPTDTVCILDFYHLFQRVAAYASACMGQGTTRAQRWMATVRRVLLGKRDYRRTRTSQRRGHRKRRGPKSPRTCTVHLSPHPGGAGEELLSLLLEPDHDVDATAHKELVGYLIANVDRTDYPSYRARGMQIGSGAMESLHRVASQMRLKLAGARWTPERAIAVLNMRLMLLAGRWDAFWSHRDLTSTLCEAFATTSVQAA